MGAAHRGRAGDGENQTAGDYRSRERAGDGLDGPVEQLARMLAVVDYERDEDVRVFGFTKRVDEEYSNLCQAARNVVEAGK